jgi:hypothetical protein
MLIGFGQVISEITREMNAPGVMQIYINFKNIRAG